MEQKTTTEEFKRRIAHHIEHVNKVGEHCLTEETTKQALILPLLDILGFSPYDPTLVKAEYAADFPGVKASERVDYALFNDGRPTIFIEAKAHAQNLTNHCPQLSRYYNATPGVTVSAITNGREWRFFTDLVNRNIMDQDPFLTIRFDDPGEDIAQQLYRFHHDQFEPGALRALAEENIYLSAFKNTITASLRECDLDFVRYVVSKSDVQRTLTGRFLDSVQPIVKQAVAQSISTMVATSLSAPEQLPTSETEGNTEANAPIVDPHNAKIITTADEQRLFEICCDILPGEDIQMRDAESYFSIVYQGRATRRLLRFWGDKRQPSLQFIMPTTDAQKAEATRAGLIAHENGQVLLNKPEDLYRLAGMVHEALEYCKNDNNFKRASTEARQIENSATVVPLDARRMG